MGCSAQESIGIEEHLNIEVKDLTPKKEEIIISRKTNYQIDGIKYQSITKHILPHLHENKKLEIIRYNKKLQKENNISLLNYKFLSNKYIKYESNKKGKEFDFYGKLKFEGEYLNGKRNGKIKYKGEY